MSDRDTLLAAIVAHPDEDTPRLMYADWLQENGQPERAEFIRIQCAPDADEAAEERAFELEERNRGRWLARMPQFSEARWGFQRGFPERLEADSELFLLHYKAFARVPWLRFLHLYGLASWHIRDFANRKWAPQWIELRTWLAGSAISSGPPQRNGPTLVALASCSQLSQLRRLTLFRSDLDAEGVRAIAESPYLEKLLRLELVDHRSNRAEDALLAPLRERFGERLELH